MSVESAQKFLRKMLDDGDLNAKIQNCENEDQLKFIIENAGFEFSRVEWVQEITSSSELEMSEDDLSTVAGGRGHTAWTHCRVYDRGATHQGNTPCDRNHMHCI